MVGLAIDVGSWYNKGSDIQKAADAAALAGVVWLPDTNSAKTNALAAAERNGFKDGVGGVSITVERVVNEARRLRVRITNSGVGSFFYGGLGGDDIDMSRQATAEYVLPVPLGSPQNQFGGVAGKSEPTGSPAPGLWGNIHGWGTDNHKGDAYAPRCRSRDNCASQDSTTHRASGYRYTIDVPVGGVKNLDVQVYDPGFTDRGSDESVDTGDRQYTSPNPFVTSTTTWSLKRSNGAIIDVDNYVTLSASECSGGGPGQWVFPAGDPAAARKNTWSTLCRISGSVPEGRYILKIQTSDAGSTANRYAIRATTSSARKARVSAYGDMSMYNNIGSGTAGLPVKSEFYLAEVAPEHKGKTLELNLYDPGEVSGDGTMRILGKDGNVAASCVASSPSSSRTFANGATLSPCQFKTAVGGSAKFNGEWVTLLLPIPTNYTCTANTVPGCWWKVQYEITGQGNDTTTWAAKVIGDPVHLIE